MGMSKIERQATVNFYFLKMTEELWVYVIDEAMDFCKKKFGIYPNYQALKIARNKVNEK